jgi:hypothetical protein
MRERDGRNPLTGGLQVGANATADIGGLVIERQ